MSEEKKKKKKRKKREEKNNKQRPVFQNITDHTHQSWHLKEDNRLLVKQHQSKS